jgi:site-specific recombinase XerD
MTFDAGDLSGHPQTDRATRDSTDALAEFLEPMRGTSSFVSCGSAARHFLFWLNRNRIVISSVDMAVVHRFAKHRCRCPRYSPEQLINPAYISRVGRFVRFLEDRGDVPRTDDVEDIAVHLSSYADRLTALGYSCWARRVIFSAAEHFAVWVRISRLRWRDVDEAVVERFVQHDCRCSIGRKGAKLEESGEKKRRRGARRFLAFLKDQGVIASTGAAAMPVEDPRLAEFRFWLKQHCGATDETIDRYLHETSRWIHGLGADPTVYDAAAIRNVVLSQAPSRSRSSVRMTATVLRSYLRFLAARSECRPELCQAVPSVARRRLASLPRYASPSTIERIIASCGTATPVGLRDRAIVLLLARLGLRAGDIRRLRISDVDWTNALLTVHGKGRRSVSLPLPQDVGDAMLAYIERGRPLVTEEHLFLRVQAPFTPLASSSEIAGIVSRILARGGIEGVPTGAHLFRHSLATSMLRTGASLESVGAVLRHRSPGTTAIYAKVDVPMLMRVAQPWPGEASC